MSAIQALLPLFQRELTTSLCNSVPTFLHGLCFGGLRAASHN